MTDIPHSNLDMFITGRPVVIKTTPTFGAGMSVADLVGVTGRIRSDQGAVLAATLVVVGGDVTLTFPTVPAGRWSGQLATTNDLIGTFAFTVIDAI